MKTKGGIGVGSASIVLVFAVLCLTVFSLITFVVASNDMALTQAEVNLVVGYYEADTLAELILADLLAELGTARNLGSPARVMPSEIRGVEIHRGWSDYLATESIYFYTRISDIKALYVHVALLENSFYILSWRMSSIDEWEHNPGLDVWAGGPFYD